MPRKNESNRFEDVIKKMEEETKKVEKKKNPKEVKRDIENKYKNSQINENKEERELQTTFNNKIVKQEELEKIEEEIRKQKENFKEKSEEIYPMLLKNIISAIFVILYFILLSLLYKNLGRNELLVVLKTASILTIFITITIYEIAYKKDSDTLAIKGIEMMIVSVSTLISIRVYTKWNEKFVPAIISIALLFAIYYVGKALIIYLKERKRIKKDVSFAKKENK